MPHTLMKKIWHYNFTTSGVSPDEKNDEGVLDDVMNAHHMSGAVPGKMHGYVSLYIFG